MQYLEAAEKQLEMLWNCELARWDQDKCDWAVQYVKEWQETYTYKSWHRFSQETLPSYMTCEKSEESKTAPLLYVSDARVASGGQGNVSIFMC